MALGYVLFIFAGSNLPLVFISDVLFYFPYPITFLVVLMTISDCVEYGQWKNGVRSEGVTLSVRPLLDKLAGAVSNGVVGLTAVFCAMTTGATAETVAADPQNIINFKIIMFGVPLVLLVISLVTFMKKVTLDEKQHAQIVAELEADIEKEAEAAAAAGVEM
jgi:lactose/raffinose/galactose permease